jgi:hypothetical protein
MTIKWLKDQGLLSVKELWVKIHYPTTVRDLNEMPMGTRMAGVLGAGEENPPATRLGLSRSSTKPWHSAVVGRS